MKQASVSSQIVVLRFLSAKSSGLSFSLLQSSQSPKNLPMISQPPSQPPPPSNDKAFIRSSAFLLASVGVFTPNRLAQKVVKMIPTRRVTARVLPSMSKSNPHSSTLSEFIAKQDDALAAKQLSRLNDFQAVTKEAKVQKVLRRIDEKTKEELLDLERTPHRFKEYIGIFERPIRSTLTPAAVHVPNPTIRFPSRGIIRDVPHLRPAILSPRPAASKNARVYSTIADNRIATLSERIPDSKAIDLAAIMKDLTDLQNLDLLRGATLKSGSGYKDAQRALYPLFHTKLDDGEKCRLFPLSFRLSIADRFFVVIQSLFRSENSRRRYRRSTPSPGPPSRNDSSRSMFGN